VFAECILHDITIPDSVTSIGTYAFRNCALTRITFGENSRLDSIGSSVFAECILHDITIPDSVTSIGTNAFRNCTLTSITFGENSRLDRIDSRAFYNCIGLTEITIPDSVTRIGSAAFFGCSSLESMTLPFVGAMRRTATNTYQYPFGYIFGTAEYSGGIATTQSFYASSSVGSGTFYIPESLQSVTITGGEILYGAFYNCSNLTSITLPDNATGIGNVAFQNCSSLTEITIPDSVTSIGGAAFRNCSSLTEITIPDSVTSIGSVAFRNCNSLTSITMTDSITSIGNYAFDGCSSLTNVFYYGTQAQWGNISIGSYNTPLTNANIHYGYKIDCTITGVTLRPDSAGIYFNGVFNMDSAAPVKRQGIVLSVYNKLPTADGTGPHSLWSEGSTSVLVTNILSQKVNDASNAKRAAMAIYARAYVELEDGSYIYGDVIGISLQQVVEAPDAQWETLDSSQKTAFTEMYAKFQTVLQSWNLPNVKNS